MRFLANENFPGDAVAGLRSGNHDVVWVRTENPGGTDQDVLARAMLERRILLTFDKDFGELAWAGNFSVVEAGRVRMRRLPSVP